MLARKGLGRGACTEGERSGINGGKRIAVTRINSARPISPCWSVQIGASGPRSGSPWRRRDLCQADKGQVRMACSNDWGASEQREQVVSGLGFSHEVCAAR